MGREVLRVDPNPHDLSDDELDALIVKLPSGSPLRIHAMRERASRNQSSRARIMTADAPDGALVRFTVADDSHAAKISSVLEALGYALVRDLSDASPESRRAWALRTVGDRYRLTPTERTLLGHVAEGLSRQGMADALDISRATVKWHMHNIFSKTGTTNEAGLLRLLLDAQ